MAILLCFWAPRNKDAVSAVVCAVAAELSQTPDRLTSRQDEEVSGDFGNVPALGGSTGPSQHPGSPSALPESISASKRCITPRVPPGKRGLEGSGSSRAAARDGDIRSVGIIPDKPKKTHQITAPNKLPSPATAPGGQHLS